MILTGPNPVVVVPSNTAVRARIVFDLDFHTYTVLWAPQGSPTEKQVSGAIPGALQTALENHVKTTIEAAEGWANGSSTITTP